LTREAFEVFDHIILFCPIILQVTSLFFWHNLFTTQSREVRKDRKIEEKFQRKNA